MDHDVKAAPSAADADGSDHTKIELVWPGKGEGNVVAQDENGSWRLDSPLLDHELRGFTKVSLDGQAGAEPRGLVIRGDRLAAMSVLTRTHRRAVRLAYFDLPRLEVDDKDAEFKSVSERRYATWLEVLRAHLVALQPLLRRDAVFVVHAGDTESALARLVLDEMLGPENHVATIIWQRSYAPRNMRGMREFTTTHDTLLAYAVDKDFLPAVGLRGTPIGFANTDDDPRGDWKAEHKGAATRRESTDFETRVPPYRWRVTAGDLPPGAWRLSPFTGVIWAPTLTRAGRYAFTVEVEDSVGGTARRELKITVTDTGAAAGIANVEWPFIATESGGALHVVTDGLPNGVVGDEYSAVVTAAGGAPFPGPAKRPSPPRYWEFAKSTLRDAFGLDRVDLGAKGDAIPRIKRYVSELGDEAVVNQVTWWPGRQGAGAKSRVFAGYTQDATRHLNALKTAGVLTETTGSAKPEPLLARLIDIFTAPDDLVIELFGDAGDASVVALKRRRRFLTLRGSEGRSERLTEGCVLPRLRIVACDAEKSALTAAATEVKDDTWVDVGANASFYVCELGEWLVRHTPGDDVLRVNRGLTDDALREAVLTCSGYVSDTQSSLEKRFHGPGVAAYIPPDSFLTPTLLGDLVAEANKIAEPLTVFYFRASEDLDVHADASAVTCRRIPYQLGL